MSNEDGKIGRRSLVKTSAGIMSGALLSREAAAEQAAQQNINTNTSPSPERVISTLRRNGTRNAPPIGSGVDETYRNAPGQLSNRN
jgi:hypothetical protein